MSLIQKLKELFGSGQTTAQEEQKPEESRQYQSNVRFIPIDETKTVEENFKEHFVPAVPVATVSQETPVKTRGRSRKWTKKACKLESKKYQTKSEFAKGSKNCYQACVRYGWIDEFFDDKNPVRGKNQKKTKEYCQEIAKTCSTRTEFFKKDQSAYMYSLHHGWLDEFFGKKTPKCKMMIQEVASKYKSSGQFKKKNKDLYKYALYHGWLREFFPNEKIYPTKEGSIRQKLIDYCQNCGHPLTRSQIREKMLEIAGQPLTRKEYGVSLVDNVSLGSTVFAPTIHDGRYLKPIKRHKGDYKTTLYEVVTINV